MTFALMVAFFSWNMLNAQKELPEDLELGVVQKGDVMEIVSETGFVKAVQSVDLAFERGGRIASSTISEGDKAGEGDMLMSIDSSEQKSNLIVAKSRLEAEQIRLQELMVGADNNTLMVTETSVALAETALKNAQQNLTDVIAFQNQLVQNAQKTLRSSSLQAYLVSDGRENTQYSFVAPTVTGTYTGGDEGVYRLELYNSSAPSGSSFIVTGLEKGTWSVSTVDPVSVGTRGLYVQFPENFKSNTEWEIPVPNTRSSTYLANLNAYNAALESQNVAITNAESAAKSAEAAFTQAKSKLTQVSSSARQERIFAQKELIRQVAEHVSQAQKNYDDTTILAPFSGVISEVNTEVGQIVSPSVPVVRLISDGQYELVVDITEVDIQEVSIGDSAIVTFDAYDDVELTAKVSQVAPNAKDVFGVQVFKVTLIFDAPHELIKDGLTAQIDIVTATRNNVVIVPTRSVFENQEGKFVRTITEDGQIAKIDVTTGLRGSNGMTEIIDGLSEGVEIITFASKESIDIIENY